MKIKLKQWINFLLDNDYFDFDFWLGKEKAVILLEKGKKLVRIELAEEDLIYSDDPDWYIETNLSEQNLKEKLDWLYGRREIT